MGIVYTAAAKVTVDEAIDLYIRSSLGERRPIENRQTVEDMYRHANLIVSAWADGKLVGIARTLTDFSYVAYLADLAVDTAFQKQGIGKKLIDETQSKLGTNCMMVLLAAPKAHTYYEHLGFEAHPRAWIHKK